MNERVKKLSWKRGRDLSWEGGRQAAEKIFFRNILKKKLKKKNPAISSYLQCPVFSVITWQELTTSKEYKHKMRVYAYGIQTEI